jgi:hypothetical protein
MEPIFNGPVIPDHLEQALRIGLGRGEAGDPIHPLLRARERFGHAAPEAKDLSYPRPLSLQKVVEFCAGDQRAYFPSSMPFVHRFSFPPISTLERRLAEKELHIFL